MISNEIKFLLTHSSIYGIGTVASRIVGFLLLPLYTRYLTPTDYGVLETIEISNGIIGIVVTVGIVRALSRFYYEQKDEEYRSRVISTTYITYAAIAFSCLPVLLVICAPLSGLVLEDRSYGYYFQIGFVSLILGGLIDIGLMYLRLLKKPVFFISITISRLILLVTLNILFVVYFKLGVLGILYSSLTVRLLAAPLICFVILSKTKLRFSSRLSIDMLKYGLPMIPSNLAMTTVKQSDKYFVLALLSVHDLGIYSLALRFGNTLHNLMTIPFNLAYIPRRFEIMKQGDARSTFARIFTYYTFVTISVGLAISILIPEILVFMVAPAFRSAGTLVPLVVLSMIIFGTHYHFDFGILYSKKTKYIAYINTVCALLHLGTNYLLVLNYGMIGGVVSSIIVMSIQAAALFFTSQRLFHIDYEFHRVFSMLSLAIVTFAISTLTSGQDLLISITMKCLLLMLFLYSALRLGIVTPEERKTVVDIFNSQVRSRFIKKPAEERSTP